ncbi:hypothetical protein PTTG_01678 [Puccinia triticina 1-1 BBBD Race 1]|uniref:CBF domain-containing protein n=1 Tax=Puccinia triticina (isolate 1-1 / race 1 (BBBD)) TaxID=630390 RepID=A0A180GH95_PUCT1|nr:hypothetical protein PTTG_01678 [Puccinia triticina 1-1 BBBD Race 1]
MASKSSGSSSNKAQQSIKITKQTLKQIKELEQQIKLAPNQDLNPIADLLERLSEEVKEQRKQKKAASQPAQVTHALIYSLHRIFSSLIRQGRIHGSPSQRSETQAEEEAVKLVKDWLKTQYSQFIDCLLALLRTPTHEESGAQIELDYRRGCRPQIPSAGFESSTFLKLVKALLIPNDPHQVPPSVRAEFILRYLNFCDDIRFRFLKDATFLCQSFNPESSQQGRKKKKAKAAATKDIGDGVSKDGLTRNLLMYLESLTTMPTSVDELNQFWTGKPQEGGSGSGPTKRKSMGTEDEGRRSKKKTKVASDGSTGIFDDPTDSEDSEEEPDSEKRSKDQHPLLVLRAHQKAFSDCWVAFLSLQGLAEADIKRVLKILHNQVIPHMIDPKILMDFLVDCLDYGGSISVLSLNALFTLMSKHNLDYPDFYTKLYALIDSSIMHTRHRPRFFRMLEVFLSSTHLPVNIVASFIKKIARISLFATPGAIIAVVPFCYNLIKMHPTVMALLHRIPDGQSKTLKALEISDPFRFDEPDPLKTEAIFSSAWEFVGLRSHYLASIATLFKVFQESFDKPKYDLEDFLDHTYSSLIETELTRLIKKPPALSLFASSYKQQPSTSSTLNQKNDSSKCVVVDDIVNQMWKI